MVLVHLATSSSSSSLEVLRAAGVTRGWRTAARSVAGLRFSFDVDLIAQCTNPPPWEHTAAWQYTVSGLARLRRCVASPAAAHISELALDVTWLDVSPGEAVPPSLGIVALGEAHQSLGMFPALQQLKLHFQTLADRSPYWY